MVVAAAVVVRLSVMQISGVAAPSRPQLTGQKSNARKIAYDLITILIFLPLSPVSSAGEIRESSPILDVGLHGVSGWRRTESSCTLQVIIIIVVISGFHEKKNSCSEWPFIPTPHCPCAGYLWILSLSPQTVNSWDQIIILIKFHGKAHSRLIRSIC